MWGNNEPIELKINFFCTMQSSKSYKCFFQKIYHLTGNFQDINKNLKNSSLKNGMYNLLLHVANAT